MPSISVIGFTSARLSKRAMTSGMPGVFGAAGLEAVGGVVSAAAKLRLVQSRLRMSCVFMSAFVFYRNPPKPVSCR